MKLNQIDIENIFGKDRAQEDMNLSKYFIKTSQYDVIKAGLKELVLGRKGSGKSALYSVLTNELQNEKNIVINISPKGEEIVLVHKKINEYGEIKLDDDFKYSIAWRNFLLTEIALAILSNKKTIKEANPLYPYLVDTGTINRTFVDKFVTSILKAFATPSVKINDAEFSFDFTGVIDSKTPEYKIVIDYIKKVISEENYYILIDNLDEPWKNNFEMNSWLRGLILASRQLKRDFQNLKIIVFLRDDIFSEISKGSDLFDSQSEIIKINWVDENNYNLRKLLAQRISIFYSDKYPYCITDINDLWNKLYPETVSYRTSRGPKYINTDDYIIDRTFFRPREMLKFCKIIIEKSAEGNIPVTSDVVLSAELEFCDWKLNDLVGEYSKSYTGIDNFIFAIINCITEWGVQYSLLKPYFDSFTNESKIKDLVKNEYLGLESTITLLYSIGFLRRHRRNNYGKNIYTTSAEEMHVNPLLHSFDIHPAFRKLFITRK